MNVKRKAMNSSQENALNNQDNAKTPLIVIICTLTEFLITQKESRQTRSSQICRFFWLCNLNHTLLMCFQCAISQAQSWVYEYERVTFSKTLSVGLTFLSLKTRAISLWFWHLPPPPPLPSPHEIYNVILYCLIFSSWNHSCSFTNYVHNIRLSIPILRSFFCPNGSHRKLAEAGNTPRRSTFSYSIK